MVFPFSVAPAASNAATAGADVAAGLCPFNQSGLPPPVGVPATSIRSLTANVSPFSGPAADGPMVTRGPGTNAPKSAAAELAIAGSADVNLSSCPLAERGDHRIGIGDETEAFLDVPDCRFRAEIRRCGRTAVFDQETPVSKEVGVGQGVKNALIGIDACKQDCADAEVAQNAVERCVPESADTILVDLDVFRRLDEFIHHSSGP